MSTDSTQKVAIVTGASRGIGKAIAEKLAKDGFLAALVARDEEKLSTVQKEIEAGGGVACTHVCDLAQRGAFGALIEQIFEEYGRIDVLVNNAGVSPFVQEPQAYSEDDWDKIFDLNLKATFFCARDGCGNGFSIWRVKAIRSNGSKW